MNLPMTFQQTRTESPPEPDTIHLLGNPLWLLLITVATIFIAELLIMILLWFLPMLEPFHQALFDASLLSVIVFPVLYFAAFRPMHMHIGHRERVEAEKDALIEELRNVLAEVKSLQGIIPICASCKKIRDDHGFWQQVETYVSDHSNALFSHGICPECAKKLYSEFRKDEGDDGA